MNSPAVNVDDFQNSSYYMEYLSQLSGHFNPVLPLSAYQVGLSGTQRILQQQGVTELDSLEKHYNEDIGETTPSVSNWVYATAAAKGTGLDAEKEAAFKFENVSSAAFFEGSVQRQEHPIDQIQASSPLNSSGDISISDSIASGSNRESEDSINNFDTPTLAALEDKKNLDSEVKLGLDIKTSNSAPEIGIAALLKPSYKEILEKRVVVGSSSKTAGAENLKTLSGSTQQQQKADRTDKKQQQPQQHRNSSASSSTKKFISLKKGDSSISHKTTSTTSTSQISLDHNLQSNSQKLSQVGRNPASSGDICKIITKSIESRCTTMAERSGSDISAKSGKVEAVQQTHQYPAYQQLPPNAVTYHEWSTQFRMPRCYAPPAVAGPNIFRFPHNDQSDPKLLSQVKAFRKSLTHHEGRPIERCVFEDFVPKLNFFTKAGLPSPRSGRKLYTDSQPIKIFDAPPSRNWIPVRCDALDIDLRLERAVDGHAGKAGGKAQVSIVYDAKNTSKKVMYIRKEYYDLEYFTNEYNFLQFAHHPHIPKPFCVEYNQYPKIVMEFVEGERVHMAFYMLGKALLSQFPNDPRARWDKMSVALGRVLGKLLVTIKYIHSIGFIHADLKPENIIYDLKTGRIAIIDFDLSVSAPYTFTGRGTEATIAPEINGLLKGPVHFGLDWWAYGSTAAMMIADALAGTQYDSNDPDIDKLIQYVPFKYDRATNQYEMTPIPKFFPPIMRSFLYPFFHPDPSKRNFSEANAYNWIRGHPMFTCVEDWKKYENLDLGVFAAHTPLQLGCKRFSKRPFLLQPVNRLSKLINGLSNLFYLGNVFPISNPAPPEKDDDSSVASSAVSSSSSSISEDDNTEDNTEDTVDEREEEKTPSQLEIFQFDDEK